VHRLGQWLNVFLGVEQTAYVEAVSRCWPISAVARIYGPGCKADCALIMEGPQGKFKSTAVHKLAGEFFTDDIGELGTKDAAMQTAGKWIIEIAELDSMTRGEVTRVKAFMSRAVDRYRPPYGRSVVEQPRQCVFVGTVNQDAWNPDETGGRRFWPVVCGAIDAQGLADSRDQLWAEAVAEYKAGATWWLDTPELNQAAEAEQSARYQGDSWDEVIFAWATTRVESGGKDAYVTTPDVLKLCLEKPVGQWTRADEMRVSKCLKSRGWERFRGPRPEKEWRYRPQNHPKVGSK